FARIMTEELPPIDWIVDRLIAQGDRVIVYGEFGSMKSWLLLHLAIHIAAGRPWLEEVAITAAHRVLYIDEEMNERTLRRRIRRLGAGAGLTNEPIPFRVLSRVGIQFNQIGADRLLGALAATDFDPEIIVVETFRRVLVGSENETEDVTKFWGN